MDLAHLVLEDSYVLGISVEPYFVELRMDFVLSSEHPQYRAPNLGEQECYRRGLLRVVDFQTLIWRASNLRPSADSTGELDYGCLDKLAQREGLIVFAGDWGEIEVRDGKLVVSIDN